MAAQQIEILKQEKRSAIKKYLSLKNEYQKLYFKHEETKLKNEEMQMNIAALQEENKKLSGKIGDLQIQSTDKLNRNVVRENKQLIAKIDQLKRCSISDTPKRKIINHGRKEYEVEKIVNVRGTRRNKEFLVRWKNFSPSHDSWEKEKNLHCPKILQKYLNSNT